ncbi:hypothetical protein ACSQ67_020676 [Phaseolus vulgaris]
MRALQWLSSVQAGIEELPGVGLVRYSGDKEWNGERFSVEGSGYEEMKLCANCGSRFVDILNRPCLWVFASSESCDVSLPGDNDPYWLAHMGDGHSVSFTVPQHRVVKGMALCVVYLSTSEIIEPELTTVLIVNYTKCTCQIHNHGTLISFNDDDWPGIMSNLGSEDKVEIFRLLNETNGNRDGIKVPCYRVASKFCAIKFYIGQLVKSYYKINAPLKPLLSASLYHPPCINRILTSFFFQRIQTLNRR